MIRTFFKFLLSRSLDEGKSPAPWLQRHLQRDAQLNRFDNQTRQLDTLLRSSAADIRQAMTANSLENDAHTITLPPERQFARNTASVQPSRHSAVWLAGLAAAAVLLLMVTPSWFRPAAPTVHAGELSERLTVVPGEVLNFINRAAETSQTHLPRLSPLNHLPVSELPTWQDVVLRVESPLRQEFDSWRLNWQTLQLPSKPPVEE